jgi:hypothetical protein
MARNVREEHDGSGDLGRCLSVRQRCLETRARFGSLLTSRCLLGKTSGGDFKIRGPLAAAAQVGPAVTVSVNPRARLRTSNVGDTVAWVKELSPAILAKFPDFRGGPSGSKSVQSIHTTLQRRR